MKGKGKPIGKGHKGQHRRFTNFEEIEAQQKRLAKQAEWRKQRGDDEEEDEEASDEEDSEENSDEEETASDEEEIKPKGVESLIEVQNPNRVPKKPAPEVKAGTSTAVKPEMSRREKEEAERQRKAASVSLKTEQARADLARLALIKQQRETARLKREAELKAKEEEKKAKEATSR